jgi:hypothetical protein
MLATSEFLGDSKTMKTTKNERKEKILQANELTDGKLREDFYKMSDGLLALAGHIALLPKEDADALRKMIDAAQRLSLGAHL